MKRQAIVGWFDRLSGHGVMRDVETDSPVRVYACNILGAKSLFEHLACMYLEPGQLVDYELSEGCGACKVTGGILDIEAWDRIKNRTDLAFTQNAEGQISGLFNTESED